ncbi:protein rhomboid-like isoform X1 [Saccostrea cucullata]|uniref:protein rhomboid-like isoform X1 n=2 Tax=Saccostrea cuccullata TaxID=36930 RepID=UPI002ED14868
MAGTLQMQCEASDSHNESFQRLVAIMNAESPCSSHETDQGSTTYLRPRLLRRRRKSPCFQMMVRYVAKGFLTKESDRQYYADRYTCCPPPWFIPVITLAEIGLFTYHCLDAGVISANGPIPVESVLIYRPDRRIQLWRFITYTLIHAGWVHLFFNMLVQILVGLPLEMVHGSGRVMIVYISGVLAGSLGTSVFDTKAYLAGASGGVYSLLAAHLANIMLNYSEMEFGLVKVGAVLIIASADVGFAVWDRLLEKDLLPQVSYTAHLMGSLAGLTVGLLVLKNFDQRLYEQYLWWIAFAVYMGWTVFAVCWNVFYY